MNLSDNMSRNIIENHNSMCGADTMVYDDDKCIDSEPLETQVLFFRKRYEEMQTEFEEFQMSSRELETELETQLHIHEKRVRDLDAKNQHLVNENEFLRNKLDKTTNESRSTIDDLQKKLKQTTELNEQLTAHIRDLEQSNDDLERAKRHLDVTLQDFDSKLNEQIERNELLESEIGEKEELHVVIQRLKDEARDLRLELMIQQSSSPGSSKSKKPPTETASTEPKSPKTVAGGATALNSSNGSVANGHENHSLNSSSSPVKASPVTQIPLLSASSRISALNIVSDLLRKVGALESKLASCRTIVPVSSVLISKNNNNAIKSKSSGPNATSEKTSPTTDTGGGTAFATDVGV